MNPHLQTTLNLYESDNIDLQNLIGWHLSHGIVVCNPKVFALGFHSHSSNPEQAIAFEDSDTLYVTICCGDMFSGLQPFQEIYKYITFRRDFKGSNRTRLFNMKKFYSKLR